MTAIPEAPVSGPPVEKVDLRGAEVAYRRRGEGPPLLFFHGLGFSQRWHPLHERLAERFDVIAPDLQGFGDSPPESWMTGFDDLALHYAELADVLGLHRFHLVGHSFGGWVAAEFASFYPERLASLTLITPLGLRVPGDIPRDLFRMTAAARLDVQAQPGEPSDDILEGPADVLPGVQDDRAGLGDRHGAGGDDAGDGVELGGGDAAVVAQDVGAGGPGRRQARRDHQPSAGCRPRQHLRDRAGQLVGAAAGDAGLVVDQPVGQQVEQLDGARCVLT